jgi:hypothetical protein
MFTGLHRPRFLLECIAKGMSPFSFVASDGLIWPVARFGYGHLPECRDILRLFCCGRPFLPSTAGSEAFSPMSKNAGLQAMFRIHQE